MVTERDSSISKLDQINADIASAPKTNEDFNTAVANIQTATVRYYPAIIQEKLLLMLNDRFMGTGMMNDASTYVVQNGLTPPGKTSAKTSEPATSAQSLAVAADQFRKLNGETPISPSTSSNPADPALLKTALSSVQSLNATIDFTGTYNQLREFVSQIEAQNRMIQIDQITYKQIEGEIIKGQVILNFHAIPKLTDQDTDYTTWQVN